MPEDILGTDGPEDIEIVYEDEEIDSPVDSDREDSEDERDQVVEVIVEDDEPIVDLESSDEYERLNSEIQELREGYLRKLAEFDNFRKRTEREREDLIRTAGEQVVRELIPVLDNFERALQHASESDPESFRLGVEMISKQLVDVLDRLGLEAMDPTGEPFEPEFHEALQRVEDSDQPPGTVAWVLAKGYSFGGKLLRPAMVGVSVEPSKPAAEPGLEVEDEAEGEGTT